MGPETRQVNGQKSVTCACMPCLCTDPSPWNTVLSHYMVYHALSNQVKKIKQHQEKNVQMQKAVEAYKLELVKPIGKRQGARKIAKDFGLERSWRTILNHAGGMYLCIWTRRRHTMISLIPFRQDCPHGCIQCIKAEALTCS